VTNELDAAARARRVKLAKRAALAGAALALLCPLLPERWHAVCHALVSLLAP
jgi:hypothetical protein